LSHSLCICDTFPRLVTRTRIVLLAHRFELTKSTNTAKLVAHMLGERAELVPSDAPCDAFEAAADSWVLFPSEDAQPLEEVAGQVGCLIVPDGTWSQARRIARRHPRCKELKKVRLESAAGSAYCLRRAARNAGLCTLEAVAHALRVLEGDGHAELMLAAFEQWVQRALLVRAGAHNLPSEPRP